MTGGSLQSRLDLDHSDLEYLRRMGRGIDQPVKVTSSKTPPMARILSPHLTPPLDLLHISCSSPAHLLHISYALGTC
jgi:hypothetical protein